MNRTLSSVIIGGVLVAAACGSPPTVSEDDSSDRADDDDDDDDSNGRGPRSPLFADGGLDGGPGSALDFVSDDEEQCEPARCDDLDFDCGPVVDGCGGIVDCGECSDGQVCGLFEHNVCATLDEICEPIAKADACEGKECGSEGNGCGGTHDCGTCDDDQACGLEEPFQCARVPVNNDDECGAVIANCEAAGVECGETGNGCGGTLDCGGCPDGQYCGIEAPGQCDPPPACEPATPEEACVDRCGLVSNGCSDEVDGGLIDCSDYEEYQCPDGTACGAGGVANECGSGDGTCSPLDQNAACEGRACGVVSDGCSSSFACGSCSEDSQCVAGACQPICTPMSANEACEGKQCGVANDGCGSAPANTFDCAELSGGCGAGEYCGLLTAFQCDAPVVEECTPADSCEDLGWECGAAIDECGNVFDCAGEGLECDVAIETCIGGIDGPARCVSELDGGPGSNCDVCDAIPDCSGQAQLTRVSGRVVTPGRSNANTGNQVGVPNAFVYILRNNDETELPAIDSGIPAGGTACDRCADQELGPVLIGATTDAGGNYTLEGNIPIGEEFVLVVKIGRFRRAQKLTLDVSAACVDSALPETVATNPTRLARNVSDGLMVNMPQIAISTGQLDAIECVFEKIGIAPSEFTNPDGPGRIHLYRGGNASSPAGARIDTNTPHDVALYSDISALEQYDMIVADCEGPSWDGGQGDGGAFSQRNANGALVREYVNRGGRMFASHLSFSWLHENGTAAYSAATFEDTGLSPAATWTESLNTQDETGTGVVSNVGNRPLASPRIQNFADWMVSEGVTTAPGYAFTIDEPRSQATALGTQAEEFVFRSDEDERVQQFSFNTPYAAPEDAVCGRVAYSGFHVVAGSTPQTALFPAHCSGNLTDQEKVLLYMLFDVGACVGDVPEAPECEPLGCDDRCGTFPDGCGGVLSCTCPQGEACLANLCGPPPCTVSTCAAQAATCGVRADGCGGVLDCGPCECPAETECPMGVECGVVDDGCGNALNCGNCPPPQVCTDGTCGIPDCPALSCEDFGASCGWVGDGCSDSVNCGMCPPGQFCENNQCSGCNPRDCADVDAECGAIGNGCGGIVDCGPCPEGEACGIEAANQCGPPGECPPRTCEDRDAECGQIGDGCGGAIDCGECPPGEICGFDEAFKCGEPPPCVPDTCEERDAECGQIGDGCGNLRDCGECPPGETCGLFAPNQCAATGVSK
jgi:hypothetical protein